MTAYIIPFTEFLQTRYKEVQEFIQVSPIRWDEICRNEWIPGYIGSPSHVVSLPQFDGQRRVVYLYVEKHPMLANMKHYYEMAYDLWYFKDEVDAIAFYVAFSHIRPFEP